MDRFEMMEALGDLPEQYFAESLPQTGASDNRETPFRLPRLVTAGALAACTIFAVGVSAVLLHGRLAERTLSSAEDSEENTQDSAYDSEAEYAVQTSVSASMTAAGNTPYSTDTEPNTESPALYALPEYENLSDWKTWETTTLAEPGIYYNGADVCAGMSVIARTDPAGQPVPAGNPEPQLQIGQPHTEMYAVSFDFFIPKDGSVSFVMYDGANTVFADDWLGEEQFWFTLTANGSLSRRTTFGKNDEQLPALPDFQSGIWHHCYLKAAADQTGVFIDNQFSAMLDELGAARSGYLALDGTPGVMFANFAFYDSTETAPVTLTPSTPPPDTDPAMTERERLLQHYVEWQGEENRPLLECITDRPYDEVLTKTISRKIAEEYIGFHLRQFMSNVPPLDVWSEKTGGIELLRVLPNGELYTVQRVEPGENGEPGGLFYSYFSDNGVLKQTMWMSGTLKKSDFDGIREGDSLHRVFKLEPVAKVWAEQSLTSSFYTNHLELLLKDGVMIIQFVPAGKNDAGETDWTITNMEYYPDFLFHADFEDQHSPDSILMNDYSILPEDYPE
ncbi:MAG: hypothetical protein IKX57_01630 [Oscillospiraceae bacterium]|nr:hypothetical protein [Oscillospiraceae bacterium]